MPQIGEIRRGKTESGQWDGQRWQPITHQDPSVDRPVSFGILDSVPGLRDVLNLPVNAVKGAEALPDVARGLIHEPAATLKGFVGGASEAATPGRLGLLALLTAGATAPAALGAAGGEALAEGGRYLTDAPNASRSLPEAAMNVVEAGSVPAVAAGLKAVPGAVGRMGGTRKVAGQLVGAGIGGYEGYRYGGVPGAIAGAVTGGAVGGGRGSASLRGLQRILGVEAAEKTASDVAPEIVDRFKPNRSGIGRSREVPGFSMPKEVPAEPPLPRSVAADVEPYKANRSGFTGKEELAADDPLPRSVASDVEPYKPNVSAGDFDPSMNSVDYEPPPRSVMSEVDRYMPNESGIDSPSMRGLEEALSQDEAVSRYLARFDKLPSDADIAADIIKRNASGKWDR